MKKLIFLLISLLTTYLFYGCEEETIFRLSDVDHGGIEEIPYCNPEDGGDLNKFRIINLYVNKPWTAKSNQPWCLLSQSFGDGSDLWVEIVVSFDKNDTYDNRQCAITFYCDGQTITKEYEQRPVPYSKLLQSEYIISADEQQVAIEIETNYESYYLFARSSQSWAKYVPTKGISPVSIVIAVDKNQTRFTRSCKVDINGAYDFKATAVIKQNGQL